jgi:hypothetical protein
MGRRDLERGDGSDDDGELDTALEIPGDNGGSDVVGGEVSAGETPNLDEKPKTKRVASEKMKAALLRVNMAKAEKRWSRIETRNRGSRPKPQFLSLLFKACPILDTVYTDAKLDDGTHVFSLRDPLTVRQGHALQVRLLNAWLSHTYYNIFDGNDTRVLH